VLFFAICNNFILLKMLDCSVIFMPN